MRRPVLVGVLGVAPSDEALRCAFDEADDVSGDDGARRADLVRRWSQKHPDVAVTTVVRRVLDPAVVLVAASRGCSRVVLPQPPTPAGTALIDAVSRRAHCPVDVIVDRAA